MTAKSRKNKENPPKPAENQQAASEVFSKVGMATLLVAPDLTITMINDAFIKRSGYTKEEVEGRMRATDFPIEADKQIVEDYNRQRQNGETTAPRTYQITCRDRFGRSRNLLIATDRVPGTRETVAFLLDTAELETMLANEQLVRMGQLAAGAAHGIRNTLSSIKLRLYSLEHSSLDIDQRDDLKAITAGFDYIERAINHYFEFSRPPRLTPELCRLEELIDNAITLASQRGHIARVKLRRVRAELPELNLDRQLFTETLAILISNAGEAMAEGGTLTITEQYRVTDQPYAVISFSDTGPGVDKELIDKIFEPFFTTKPKGTGLGLATARRVVEAHGGWLECLPRKSRGACFRITLPLKEK
ncbi:MAG: Sensor protein ZraS [Deltaproteobacteria bacterium ADurb.Bin510]|nr:MAG: Sensor protein ZraS [Deltaproteobacteria bacterium ADurb.Bin510]